ncbi:Acyltransferase family domain protein [Paenarthrobacter aurescens TC1]|uniref:Acyltransferase family domain protein n=2 Tax=Paenarthrobacter aurescens TaxID=43663 RepID=A1R8L6_PAEAT|nr:Acyltransferase family domain protein [Paenarthrobacter aurescens TC1]
MMLCATSFEELPNVTTPTIPAPAHHGKRAAGPVAKSKFRPEIQGLRSLAVLMVVSYHIWIGRVSGGVDVFLLISAFLMTLQFTGRYKQGRPMDLLRHWLHLFRRLLPAVVVVLVGTLAATFAFLPATRWVEIVQQTWASLFYFENRLLQELAVDYYATDHSMASPVQHFWSLSIQGQVFILWPIIFATVALVCRRFALRYRATLMYVFAIIFLVSFIYSIIFTANNQAVAYFDTFARLWEFALGTLVALILPALNFSKPVRVALGWIGVAAMLTCGILLQVQTAFPGFVALWPTLAAVAVIAAGQTGSRFGVDRILSSKFLVRLGDNSYALYLWHWPILVIALAWSGKDHAGWLSGTAIIALSLVLAFLTTKYIEKPFREWKWPEMKRRRSVIAIVACLAVVSAPLLAFQYRLDVDQQAAEARMVFDNPGAKALLPTYVNEVAPNALTQPTAERIGSDWANLSDGCSGDIKPESQLLQDNCQQNGVGADATKTVLVVGSSHSQQWLAALEVLAEQHHWRVYSLLAGACPFMTEDPESEPGCNEFNSEVRSHIQDHAPDAIFMVGTAAVSSLPDERLTHGFEDLIPEVTGLGIQVVAVRDNPRFTYSLTDCTLAKGVDSPDCRPLKSDVLAEPSPFDAVRGKYQNLFLLDMTDLICLGIYCPPIIGNTFVYLDDNHLTKTYVKSMAGMLDERWFAATGWQQ